MDVPQAIGARVFLSAPHYRYDIMKINIRENWLLLKEAFKGFNEREPFNNSIIIAYYTIFSLPGLLVIMINIAGYFFGTEAITSQLSGQIGSVVGGETAKQIETMVATASKTDGNVLSTILSVATLLFGATGVFYQLQQILNKIWGVRPAPKQKLLKVAKDRFFSFGLILAIGFLLLVSLVLSSMLHALSDWVSANLSESMLVVFSVLDIVVSLAVVTLLFAAIYKFLPDARVEWNDVWAGAILTSLLFVVAKFLLGLYFGNSDPGSAYGAAGSIILIMLWVSYAGLILLYGAEYTRVHTVHRGKRISPTTGAEIIPEGESDNGAIVNKKANPQPARGKQETPDQNKHERNPGNPNERFEKRTFGGNSPRKENRYRNPPPPMPDSSRPNDSDHQQEFNPDPQKRKGPRRQNRRRRTDDGGEA